MGARVLAPQLTDANLARDTGGALTMGGVSLTDIADAVGTPAYVYDADTMRARYASLDAAFGDLPHRICYAIKANSNLAVLRLFAELGGGADIVSGGELLRALAAGFAPSDIVFSGVGKTDEELLAAMTAGVGQINVESVAEIRRLSVLTDLHDIDVTVGVRVNPDVTVDTHPYITTGKGGLKFGVPLDQFDAVLAVVDQSGRMRLGAIAMHVGSQLLQPDPYRAGLDALLGLLNDARTAGHTPDVLDLGGGLGIRYHDEAPMTPEQWMGPLHNALRASGCTVHVEPGRYLVGSAGVMLARVVYGKRSGGRELVVVDAAMNDLIRPALYHAWHDIVPVQASGASDVMLDVVGPVCETGDFLALEREMPGVRQGDLVAVLGAGAYGFAMSSNYNTRPRAVEVLIDAGRWAVIRPRERLTDLFRDEIAEPFANEGA